MSGPASTYPPGRTGTRPAPRITTVLDSLAAQRASGVLEVDGDPAGVIFLDHGQITYAEASWVPDLAARFCASQRPPQDVRALLLGGGPHGQAPSGDLGPVLLNCVSRAELQALLRSAIVDAIIALTVPLSGDATVSGIRFEAPRAHWASAFARLPLDSVRDEAVCRAARLARYGVSRTSIVSLRDLDQSAMVLTRDQWAIASRIGRTSTVRDLAWCSGLALCDTIECVACLVRAGVCTLGEPTAAVSGAPSGAPSSAPPAAPVTAPSSAPAVAPSSAAGGAEPGSAPVMLPAPGAPESLPRRRPGTHLASELRAAREVAEAELGTRMPRATPPVPARYTPPPPDVLHRLLDGLRNLK